VIAHLPSPFLLASRCLAVDSRAASAAPGVIAHLLSPFLLAGRLPSG